MTVLPSCIQGAYYPQWPLLVTSWLSQRLAQVSKVQAYMIIACPPKQAAMRTLAQFRDLPDGSINHQQV